MSNIQIPRCECGWASIPVLNGGIIGSVCRNPKCRRGVPIESHEDENRIRDAAPDLLAALERVAKHWEGRHCGAEWYVWVTSAIAKARGI